MRQEDRLDTLHLSWPGTIIIIITVTVLPTKDNLMGLAIRAPIIKKKKQTPLESGW